MNEDTMIIACIGFFTGGIFVGVITYHYLLQSIEKIVDEQFEKFIDGKND